MYIRIMFDVLNGVWSYINKLCFKRSNRRQYCNLMRDEEHRPYFEPTKDISRYRCYNHRNDLQCCRCTLVATVRRTVVPQKGCVLKSVICSSRMPLSYSCPSLLLAWMSSPPCIYSWGKALSCLVSCWYNLIQCIGLRKTVALYLHLP